MQVRESKLVADREARAARGRTAHLEQELSFYQAQSASAMVGEAPLASGLPRMQTRQPEDLEGTQPFASQGCQDPHCDLGADRDTAG